MEPLLSNVTIDHENQDLMEHQISIAGGGGVRFVPLLGFVRLVGGIFYLGGILIYNLVFMVTLLLFSRFLVC